MKARRGSLTPARPGGNRLAMEFGALVSVAAVRSSSDPVGSMTNSRLPWLSPHRFKNLSPVVVTLSPPVQHDMMKYSPSAFRMPSWCNHCCSTA